jgi:hypothetical protein
MRFRDKSYEFLKDPLTLSIIVLLLIVVAVIWVKEQIDEHKAAEEAKERDRRL